MSSSGFWFLLDKIISLRCSVPSHPVGQFKRLLSELKRFFSSKDDTGDSECRPCKLIGAALREQAVNLEHVFTVYFHIWEFLKCLEHHVS